MEVNPVIVNETERRKVDARAVMTATDSQMGHDPVGAMMAKYDKDHNGTFDVHECAAGTARAARLRPELPAPRRARADAGPSPLTPRRVRAIVSDVLKEKKAKKTYKGAAIGLFALLGIALAAIFGVSFAAGEAIKENHITNAEMKDLNGKTVKVDTTAPPIGSLWDIATLDTLGFINLKWAHLYVNQDGKWLETAVKLNGATMIKTSADVVLLKTEASDLTIDAAAKTCSITMDGVAHTCAPEAPSGGRRLAGGIGALG